MKWTIKLVGNQKRIKDFITGVRIGIFIGRILGFKLLSINYLKKG